MIDGAQACIPPEYYSFPRVTRCVHGVLRTVDRGVSPITRVHARKPISFLMYHQYAAEV